MKEAGLALPLLKRKDRPQLSREQLTDIRERMLSEYNENLESLQSAMKINRRATRESRTPGENLTRKPLITVVVALSDQDEKLTTSKMFERSFVEMFRQAKQSNLELDFIIVANNGGGKTEALGNQLCDRLKKFIDENAGNLNIDEVDYRNTVQPAGEIKSKTPWPLDKEISYLRKGNRVIFIKQPFSDSNSEKGPNSGKVRAIRDVSNELFKAVTEHGYQPDAILQIDAETILQFSPEAESTESNDTPLKHLYNHINPSILSEAANFEAVGTCDVLKIIDPDTGEPLDAPIGLAQLLYQYNNKYLNYLTLPGGALMVLPEQYIAGMMAVINYMPSVRNEDIAFTRLLQYANKETKLFPYWIQTVTHLNQASPEPRSFRQIIRWLESEIAISHVFPDSAYKPQFLLKYAGTIFKTRIKDIGKYMKGKNYKRAMAELKQLIIDLENSSRIYGVFHNRSFNDIYNGEAYWQHNI